MSGTLRTIVIVAGMALLTTACTQTAKQQNLVAQAYDTSGTLAGVPYKRSIFSTTDF